MKISDYSLNYSDIIARGEMDFMVAKRLTPLSIEDKQGVAPSSSIKGRRADENVAAIYFGRIRNSVQAILDFTREEFAEVDIVSGERAFGKQHGIGTPR